MADSLTFRVLRTPLPMHAVLSQKERMRRKAMENVARYEIENIMFIKP